MLTRINNNIFEFTRFQKQFNGQVCESLSMQKQFNRQVCESLSIPKSALMQCAYCGGNQSFTGVVTGSNRCTGCGANNWIKGDK